MGRPSNAQVASRNNVSAGVLLSAMNDEDAVPEGNTLDFDDFVKGQFAIVSPVSALEQMGRDEAFMAEKVMVRLVSSQLGKDSHWVSVNTEGGDVPIGVPIMMRRMFLEALLRAKSTGLRTAEKVREDGSRTTDFIYKNEASVVVEIIKDPRGMQGAEWVQAIRNSRQ